MYITEGYEYDQGSVRKGSKVSTDEEIRWTTYFVWKVPTQAIMFASSQPDLRLKGISVSNAPNFNKTLSQSERNLSWEHSLAGLLQLQKSD